MPHVIYRHDMRGAEFDQLLREQLGRYPWFGISLAAHLLMLALFAILADESVLPPRSRPVEMRLEEPLQQAVAEDVNDVADVTPPEKSAVNDTILDDETPDPHDEDKADAPYEETFGVEHGVAADVTMTAVSNLTLIGLGDGGTGSPEGRRGGRETARRERGQKTQRAVDLALEWLAKHQSADGAWDADEFTCAKDGAPCLCRESSRGGPLYDVGVTGLALLCFLGAGETDKTGQYRYVVRRGLLWLRDQQDAEGCFGSRTSARYIYNHTIASLALCEAYWLTRSGLYKSTAQRAVDFCILAQNPGKAWRYGVRPKDDDTSVSGWMLMVLKSAKTGGLRFPEAAVADALAFFDDAYESASGRTGYTSKADRTVREGSAAQSFPVVLSESLTAVAAFSRIISGQDPLTHNEVRKSLLLLERRPPVWDKKSGAIDMYYWYYGTLAMFQAGGQAWDVWNRSMLAAIVESQRIEPPLRGSWDPIDPWGGEGGRIYSTALMCLCLEVYYRYGRVFGATR